MVPVCSIDQLSGDAQTVSCSANASFEYCSRLKLLPDYTWVNVFSFEGKANTARHDVELRNLCQCVDDLFGNAIGEKFVLRIGTNVDERKDRDGIACAAWSWSRRYRSDAPIDRGYEPVTTLGDGLDNARLARIVAKHTP